jgi:CIC family chloride channel protein
MPGGKHPRGWLFGVVAWLLEVLGRFRRARHSFMVITATLIGFGGGFAAILFRYLIQGSTWTFSGGTTMAPEGFAALPWYWILLMPALGGAIVGVLVTYLAPEVRGSGVPEVMEAVALRGGKIRKRVGFAKATVVAVCLGSGGSAGREGPIVHVGAAVGSLIGRLFQVPVSQLRTFVGCGAAAGIAATFNAPIAGAMFAGEVILGQFGVVSFSAIVISSVVATVLSRVFIGDFPAFLVPEFHLEHTYELVFYAGLGLAAALVGCLFIWTLDRIAKLFARLRLPAFAKPAVGGLLVGALGIWLPQVLGVGYGAINDAMHLSLPWLLMLTLLVAKLLATSLTLGSGGSGGVFAPSLFLGAALGGLIGTGLQAAFPGHVGTLGSYALVAMGAVVAATTRAPITAIIIIFEMTNNYTIILPLMVACILAALLAGQIVAPSIYQAKLLRKGVDLGKEQDANVLRKVSVGAVRLQHAISVREDAPLEDVLEMAVQHGDLHYVVIDRSGRYLGLIHLNELRYSFFNEQALAPLVLAADLVHKDVPTLMPADNLDLALKLLRETGLDILPVVDPADRMRVLGVITRDAVIDTYNRELLDRDLVGECAGLMVTAERARAVDLGDRTMLVEIEVPPRFVGVPLSELQLRKKYDAQIMMVRR